MQPVERSELLDLKGYEAIREERRAQLIRQKAARRVHLGAHMTLLFENRDTVRYQVQEMLRIERITDPTAIAHELATYNELLPRTNELSATLLIEYETPDERDRQLRALRGLEDGKLSLAVGKFAPVFAHFDERQVADERISSVHYLRFTLPAETRAAFRMQALSGNVRFVVSHPAYTAEAVLAPATAMELANDLDAP